MAEFKSEVPIVEAESFFSILPTAFVVTAPTSDGALQILFCEDFVSHKKLFITGEESEGVVQNISVSFDGSQERVAYGRIKISLAHAKELRSLLDANIQNLESRMAAIASESK